MPERHHWAMAWHWVVLQCGFDSKVRVLEMVHATIGSGHCWTTQHPLSCPTTKMPQRHWVMAWDLVRPNQISCHCPPPTTNQVSGHCDCLVFLLFAGWGSVTEMEAAYWRVTGGSNDEVASTCQNNEWVALGKLGVVHRLLVT